MILRTSASIDSEKNNQIKSDLHLTHVWHSSMLATIFDIHQSHCRCLSVQHWIILTITFLTGFQHLTNNCFSFIQSISTPSDPPTVHEDPFVWTQQFSSNSLGQWQTSLAFAKETSSKKLKTFAKLSAMRSSAAEYNKQIAKRTNDSSAYRLRL